MPEEMLLDVVLSGEKPLWLDGNAPNDVLSGERQVCPDETANRISSIASEPPHRARRSD